MSNLIFLGTAHAIPDINHENTYMALVNSNGYLLIDCASNPIARIEEAGLDILDLSDLILSHFHPDHVSGVPLLLMSSWLLGRKKPLNIYGLAHTLDRVKIMMEGYEWGEWPGFFPVHFHVIPAHEMTPVLESDDWHIYASPVRHMIPSIGLRIEIKGGHKIVAYSGDTSPCEEVIRLADQADILIHESSGNYNGHSSADQAGEIASSAKVKHLYLVHYDTRQTQPQSLIDKARSTFNATVTLAEDLMKIDL